MASVSTFKNMYNLLTDPRVFEGINRNAIFSKTGGVRYIADSKRQILPINGYKTNNNKNHSEVI